jgi:hypothetical protein
VALVIAVLVAVIWVPGRYRIEVEPSWTTSRFPDVSYR